MPLAGDKKLEGPVTGYKMVMLPSGMHALMTLKVPKGTPIIQTGYRINRGPATALSGNPLYRTSKVMVVGITPIVRPMDTATRAVSLRDANRLTYELAKFTETHLDASSAAKGQGIHFCLDPTDAKLWPVIFRK